MRFQFIVFVGRCSAVRLIIFHYVGVGISGGGNDVRGKVQHRYQFDGIPR